MSAAHTRAQGTARPKVLVVDDDPDLQLLARMQLADGFDVIQASDGDEGIEMAVEHSPDVILLDIMMPGRSGREVLAALSEEPATKDIPIIFISALTAIEDRVQGLESGAIDYISKPADPRELKARVGIAARLSTRRNGTKDLVTDLPARDAFEARVAEEMARSRRSRAPFSILLIDIDHMDALNDRFGRTMVDALLREIAKKLRKTLRASDLLFRYGGDEFAVLLPDADIGTAYLASERLRDAIHSIRQARAQISVSVGVAELGGARAVEELVAKAEIALFRAKESGGNRSWRADDPRRHGLNPVSLSEDLTDREWGVVAHLAKRLTEPEIAKRLGISAGTVRSHKARIRRKLQVPPEIRLSEFVKQNFADLIDRLSEIDSGQSPR
ncbi:MAG: diguanylate cyclase [Actinomycetota bacterium]